MRVWRADWIHLSVTLNFVSSYSMFSTKTNGLFVFVYNLEMF